MLYPTIQKLFNILKKTCVVHPPMHKLKILQIDTITTSQLTKHLKFRA
jgi:hypothetical protein